MSTVGLCHVLVPPGLVPVGNVNANKTEPWSVFVCSPWVNSPVGSSQKLIELWGESGRFDLFRMTSCPQSYNKKKQFETLLADWEFTQTIMYAAYLTFFFVNAV